jgi:hypothetical protein
LLSSSFNSVPWNNTLGSAVSCVCFFPTPVLNQLPGLKHLDFP